MSGGDREVIRFLMLFVCIGRGDIYFLSGRGSRVLGLVGIGLWEFFVIVLGNF